MPEFRVETRMEGTGLDAYWTADLFSEYRTGSPMLGRGKTEAEALACLLYVMVVPQYPVCALPKLEINGKIWEDPLYDRR